VYLGPAVPGVWRKDGVVGVGEDGVMDGGEDRGVNEG
jgi:hypothetical protein